MSIVYCCVLKFNSHYTISNLVLFYVGFFTCYWCFPIAVYLWLGCVVSVNGKHLSSVEDSFIVTVLSVCRVLYL